MSLRLAWDAGDAINPLLLVTIQNTVRYIIEFKKINSLEKEKLPRL